MENYSVLTTVYAKDDPIALKQSIESMLRQTVVTNDYVIVADGSIPNELLGIINSYKNRYNFINFIQMPENKGLGTALNIGLSHCKNELVARLDADDISISERCELQLKEFENDSELALVGTDMYEFEGEPNNIISVKIMPHRYKEVYEYGKRRNPFNHSSVMYKKSILDKCGNYPEKRRSQDLALFTKILANGYKCINIDKPLVKFRLDISRIERKQKYSDIRATIRVYYQNYRGGYSKLTDFLYVVVVYIGFYLLPQKIANFLFKKIYRKNCSNNANDNDEFNKIQFINKSNETKILYIWFGKTKDCNGKLINNPVRALNDRCITLSNEYIFNFKRDNKNKPKFTISPNSEYREVERVFYKTYTKVDESKIIDNYVLPNMNIDLTCIVGKNGTGKSLILEYIKEILDRKNHDDLDLTKRLEYFVLFKSLEEQNKTGNCLKYVSSEGLNPIFDVIKPEKSDLSKLSSNLIFYNSFFKENLDKSIDYNSYNIIDISSNYLLNKDYNDIFEKKLGTNLELTKDIKIDKLEAHRFTELKRKVCFYANKFNRDFLNNKFLYIENQDTKDNCKNLGNLARNYFEISASDLYNKIYKYKIEKYTNSLPEEFQKLKVFINESVNYIEKTINTFRNLRKLSDKQRLDFYKLLILKELWSLCLQYITVNFAIPSKGSIENYNIEDLSILDNYSSTSEFLIKNLKSLEYAFPKDKIANLDKLINNLNHFYNQIDILEEYNDSRFIHLKLNLNVEDELIHNKLLNSINDFIDVYMLIAKQLDKSDFLNFSFYPRFSSGENSLMVLLSRLFEKFNDFYNHIFEDKNLLILLDEGEVGYHPEWSKKYVYSILNYIQELVAYTIKKRGIDSKLTNIQIIITTNSPMILSDILTQNVIQLDNKTHESKCNMAFGANILDLYSEPFFINTGLIGRFAQEKINKVLEYVNGGKKEDIDYQFIINNIGDKNIKTFLINIFKEKTRQIND